MTKSVYVGFDRDGTLEAPGHVFPARLKNQFKDLQEMGVKLFLASGKSHSVLSDVAIDLELNPWMICAESGGHIVIPSEKINSILGEASDLDCFKEKIHTLSLPLYREEEKFSLWSKKFGKNVLEAEAQIKNFILENNWDLLVYAHPDNDGGLDVVPRGIDKMNVLTYIPENSTIYFVGDAENDLSLLAHERIISCTVANAKPAVKDLVRNKKGHMSSKPVGEGVSEILHQIFDV